MAESKDSIRRIIRKYIGAVAKNNIKIGKVYLFGSYARGTAADDSDIDIAIISDDFSGNRFDDRRRVVPLRRKIDRRLEPIPYRPENFKENDPLVAEILQNGIEIEVIGNRGDKGSVKNAQRPYKEKVSGDK